MTITTSTFGENTIVGVELNGVDSHLVHFRVSDVEGYMPNGEEYGGAGSTRYFDTKQQAVNFARELTIVSGEDVSVEFWSQNRCLNQFTEVIKYLYL